jgi:hypothetical protein
MRGILSEHRHRYEGRGGQEFRPRVCYLRYGLPDVGVYTSHLGRCPMCKVLRAVDGLLVSYKGIQGSFEEPWVSGAGSAEE